MANMKRVDIEKYFDKNAAEQLKNRIVVKFVVAKISGIKKLKETSMSIQVEMLVDPNVGLDWFDYAFITRASGNYRITFYKYIEKKKQKCDVSINTIDVDSKDYGNILKVILSAKKQLEGVWW